MDVQRRHVQTGKFNFVTLLVLVVVVGGAYAGYQFIPVYIENSQITRLVQKAANNWVNMEPDLKKVRSSLQYDLDVGQVESITADDVEFARDSKDHVEAWVDYEVVIRHPWKKVTRLPFSVFQEAERGIPLE